MNDIISSRTTQNGSRPRLRSTDWREFAHCLLEREPDAAIVQILRELGQCHRADRAWLLRYNTAFTHFWNTHEWTAPGVPTFVKDLQGIPVEMGAFLHEKLEKDEAVHLRDVTRLPRRARAMAAEFIRQGIRSLLAVPVLWHGRLALQIGFDSVRRHITWPADAEEALREAGELIALRLLPDRESLVAVTREVEPALAHVREGSSITATATREIVWIESAGDYSQVHFRGGRTAMELRSLKTWENLLPRETFLRIHRAAIVNVDQIHQLTRAQGTWKIQLRDIPRLFPVGREHRALVRQHLGF